MWRTGLTVLAHGTDSQGVAQAHGPSGHDVSTERTGLSLHLFVRTIIPLFVSVASGVQ